ncbi:hypothetical protein [Kribbella sp. CA-294648]|uniref:hypothetical protein n=1 Tax=Kribbella sp. CA-294648 TaxID=3239948 RepID=UPI003D8E5E1F
MSVIKEGGPYVVALVGMAAGYFGGRGTGRESRHHARVEALYQDMLDEYAYRSRRIHDAVGIEVFGAGPPGPEVPPVSDSRIRLYASPSVSEAWGDALFFLHVLDLEGKDSLGDRATQAMFKCHTAEHTLLAAMRGDLGVPKGSRLQRVRRLAKAKSQDLVRWRARRKRRRSRARLRP